MTDDQVIDSDIDLDEGDNADWTKTQWDLLGVTDVDTLRAYLHNVGQTAADFKASTLYQWNRDTQPWLTDAVAQLVREQRV